MKFEIGGKIVELDKPAQYPYKQGVRLVQAKEKTATGIVHVEDFKLKDGTFTFAFVDMHDSDHTKLLEFFVNDTVGMLHKFDLTDDLGIKREMRFITPEISFTTNFKGLWEGSFQVEEQL